MAKFYQEKDRIYNQKMAEIFNSEYEKISDIQKFAQSQASLALYNHHLENLDDETKKIIGASDQPAKQMILEYKNMCGYISKMQEYLKLINNKLNQEVFRAAPARISQYIEQTPSALAPPEASPAQQFTAVDPYQHHGGALATAAATSAAGRNERTAASPAISGQIEGLDTSLRSSMSDDLNKEQKLDLKNIIS